MTQEEAIEFDRLKTARDSLLLTVANLRGQLETIAAKEREACAKLCETHGVHPALNVWNGGPDWYKHGKNCAAVIRARGEA